MNRVCPNCQRPLKDTHYFFCRNCGHKLEDNLIYSSVPFVSKITKFVIEDASKNKHGIGLPTLNRKIFIAMLLVLVVILSGISIFFYARLQELLTNKQSSSPNQEANIAVNQNPNTIDLDLGIKEIEFADPEKMSFIPYNVDFFMEGNDADDILGKMNDEIQENILIKPYLEYVSGDFLFFGRIDENGNWEYAIVLPLNINFDKQKFISKNTDVGESGEGDLVDAATEEKLVEGDDTDGVATPSTDTSNTGTSNTDSFAIVVENSLVITNSKNLIIDIENSARTISKNVTHKPEYSMSKSLLETNGQIRFMSFNDNIEEVISLLKEFSPKEDLLKTIDEVKQKELTKFVIRKL